jgi:hypothetical protein
MWGKVGVWSIIVVMVALWVAAVYFSFWYPASLTSLWPFGR